MPQTGRDGLPGLIRHLELDRSACFALHDVRPVHAPLGADVEHPQRRRAAASELAVDRQIEQGGVPGIAGQLRAGSGAPDLPELQGRLLAG